uniref:Uncharacterized protein n=1 Tax=Romanomermis culicivorax TaxID=13658 RepID=A0A915KPG2_ROMCU
MTIIFSICAAMRSNLSCTMGVDRSGGWAVCSAALGGGITNLDGALDMVLEDHYLRILELPMPCKACMALREK